jgi:hypothetical protein
MNVDSCESVVQFLRWLRVRREVVSSSPASRIVPRFYTKNGTTFSVHSKGSIGTYPVAITIFFCHK